MILREVINPDRDHVGAIVATLVPLIGGESDPLVLGSAILALGLASDRDAIIAICRHSKHDDEGVRLAVAKALPPIYRDEIEAGSYIPTLLALSSDTDDDVREWACLDLARLLDDDTPELRSALAARLHDPHEGTRCEAIVGLASRHDPRALPPLLAMLEEGSSLMLLVEAAAWIGDASLVPHLLDFASDDEVEAALDRCDPKRRARREARNAALVEALAAHGIEATVNPEAFDDEISWVSPNGNRQAVIEHVLARPDVNGDIQATAARLAQP